MYASAFIDCRGKERIRLRRTGWATAYVNDKPGTPEFTEAYKAWERTGKVKVGVEQVKRGSFDDLITRFYRSTEWAGLKATTRETYRGELERFRTKYGDRSASTMSARNVMNLMAAMQTTPSAANNLRKRLGQIFDYAIRQGWRADNPVKAVKALKTPKGGFRTWQEEHIEQFEAHHPIGTMPRLAFDLALYTAQRKSDVRIMGAHHTENGRIKVKQLKTGREMLIPIHPNLAASIAATPIKGDCFLIGQHGKPFSYDGFGMWFMRQCRAAGLDGFSMHGLRKAASRRMAEQGLSNQLIKSITGHVSDSEVARYTRDAEQARMADLAGQLMANRKADDLANDCEGVENAG